MWEGELAAIYLAAGATLPPRPVPEVEAVTGRGLAGDRYASGAGTWSQPDRPWGHVTLIEAETLEALRRDHDVGADQGEHRRNLVTAGVPLNHLVGREFTIGDVRLRGARLCEPCAHLDEVSGRSLRRWLVHRGGLNAEIVSGGTLRVGDPIRLERAEKQRMAL